SIGHTLSMFHERVLPNLKDNIKCGNSLIGNDFYDDQLDLFPEQMKKINAFDWENGFPEIFKQGGFDVVIGNPPYVVVKGGRYTGFEESKEVIRYYKSFYSCLQQQINIYVAFLEQSFKILSTNGLAGYIIPNTFLTNDYCRDIRQFFLANGNLHILNNEGKVFDGAVVEGLVIVFDSKKPNSKNIIKTKLFSSEYKVKQKTFDTTYCNRFLLNITDSIASILKKIELESVKLGEVAEVWRGLTTGNDKKYLSDQQVTKNYKPIIQGKNIERYYYDEIKLFVNYLPDELDRPRNPKIFEQPEKLISKFIGKNLTFCYDDSQVYVINTGCITYLKEGIDWNLKYLLGLLNSKLIDFYFTNIFTDYRDVFPLMKSGHLEVLPIKQSLATKKLHDQITNLVDNLLKLNKELQKAKLETHRNQLQRAIDHAEKKIDELVYGLYGLTEEDIAIIENNL
ncbi:MAG: TaqI-like C-terminal specificity domain-containing protein, partial [Nitrosopumilus sp.]